MCATAFHPLCAREAKLRMEVSSREDSEDVSIAIDDTLCVTGQKLFGSFIQVVPIEVSHHPGIRGLSISSIL